MKNILKEIISGAIGTVILVILAIVLIAFGLDVTPIYILLSVPPIALFLLLILFIRRKTGV